MDLSLRTRLGDFIVPFDRNGDFWKKNIFGFRSETFELMTQLAGWLDRTGSEAMILLDWGVL